MQNIKKNINQSQPPKKANSTKGVGYTTKDRKTQTSSHQTPNYPKRTSPHLNQTPNQKPNKYI